MAKLVSPITGLAGTFRHDGLAGRKAAAARGGDGDDEELKRRKREKKKARKLAGECTESSRV